MKYKKIFSDFKLFFYTIFIFTLVISLNSCVGMLACATMRSGSNSQSKIISNDIKLGMTKTEVKNLIDGPYKLAGKSSDTGEYYESWYYKEHIYVEYSWFYVETILIFNKDTLVEIKQGKERKEGARTYEVED